MAVSLCTVCKNRANHYKQTILRNIQDNKDDATVEFILLDYNSNDDLEQWVKDNLSQYIESGLFTYYKTFEPQYFQRSHSRNMAFRLASGNLVCNVDADNFTGPSFSAYLTKAFSGEGNLFMCAGGQFDKISYSDIGGRICMRPKDFWEIGGYDEDMVNYGFEDFDLVNRLVLAGVEKKLITDDVFLNVIRHDLVDRITEEFPYKNIKSVMIHYIGPSTSKMLLLFLNGNYAMATITKEQNRNAADKSIRFAEHGINMITIDEGNWVKGTVQTGPPEGLNLMSAQNNLIYTAQNINEDSIRLKSDTDIFDFHTIYDKQSIENAIMFYSETYNRTKMQQNLAQKTIRPNLNAIGSGTVYKNFDYNNPIFLQ
ncbi:MAG: hypothetical protein JWR38_2270 [Mucilaginibacter sp.]|nr:hypothetical protein [Mucilaginibacter sp.]